MDRVVEYWKLAGQHISTPNPVSQYPLIPDFVDCYPMLHSVRKTRDRYGWLNTLRGDRHVIHAGVEGEFQATDLVWDTLVHIVFAVLHDSEDEEDMC